MFSGTKAHVQSKEEKKQAEIEQLIALRDNRAALLSAVGAYIHTKYGDTSFYNDHPLIAAILQNVSGKIVDMTRLTNDITNYQLSEGE